jgi:outer membrane receptor protein involved in Fe transport
MRTRAIPSASQPAPRARPRVLALAIAALLPLTALPALADDDLDLTALPIERLVDIEVDAASRFSQKAIEAPSAVRVITQQDIRDFGWRTIAEALSSLPGLFMSYDRSYAYLGARGFLHPGDYGSRFLLLIDGNRINDPVYDQAPVGSDFPLDMDLIERIEYIPGPGSSGYGSNAFFGVINVITRSASGELPANEARAGIGSDGRNEIAVRRGWARGDAHLLIAASAGESDGADLYYPEFDTGEPASDGVARGRDGESLRQLFIGGGRGALRFSLVHGERDKSDPAASYEQLFDDPRSRNVDARTVIDVGWQSTLSPTLEASAHAFAGDYRYDGYFAYDPAPRDNRDIARARWYGAGAQLVSTAIARHKIVAGIDVQLDTREELINYDTAPRVDYLRLNDTDQHVGLFVNDEFELRRGLLVNAGARIDHDGDELEVSPRVAMIANPSESTSVKVILGEAYRTANAFESGYYLGPETEPPSIEAERIRTGELVWSQRLGAHFGFTLSLFDYRLDGLIGQDLAPSGDLYFRNIDDVRTRGGELAFDYASDGGVLVRGSVGHAHASYVGIDTALENSPRTLANFTASIPVTGTALRFGIEGRYVSERHGAQGPVPSYRTMNVTATWRGGEPGLELSGTLYNAFDAHYADPAGDAYRQNAIVQDGRTFMLRAVYRF